MKFPHKQIYFFYGNEEERLNEARRELVDSLLSKEEREENYAEFFPPPQKKRLLLGKIMPDLLAELGTISFFPDSRRVAVVYNLDELFRRKFSYGSKKKKTTTAKKMETDVVAYFIKYLEYQLLKTNNVLILINVEDYEQNRRVGEKSKLVMAIRKIGYIAKFASTPLTWDFEDALRGRNLSGAIEITRRWFKKDAHNARKFIFYSMVRQIILMLQAKVSSKKRAEFQLNPELYNALFPDDLKINIARERDFLQRKIKDGMRHYSITELTTALRKLLDINVFLYPRTTDIYVPDIQVIYEKFLVELMSPGN